MKANKEIKKEVSKVKRLAIYASITSSAWMFSVGGIKLFNNSILMETPSLAMYSIVILFILYATYKVTILKKNERIKLTYTLRIAGMGLIVGIFFGFADIVTIFMAYLHLLGGLTLFIWTFLLIPKMIKDEEECEVLEIDINKTEI